MKVILPDGKVKTIHKLHYVDSTGHAYTIYRGKFVTETNNLLHIKDYEGTINGVTVTIKNDLITLNGTATRYTENYLTNSTITTTENCVLSVEYICGNVLNYVGANTFYNNIFSKETRYPATSINGIVPTTATNTLSIRFSKGVTFENFTYRLQLEEGSTETDYKPHKHIAFN